jgi:hypothetical protein
MSSGSLVNGSRAEKKKVKKGHVKLREGKNLAIIMIPVPRLTPLKTIHKPSRRILPHPFGVIFFIVFF